MRADPPLIAGISLTFTSNGDEAIGLAQAIRRVSPATAIILGGTAPSEDPQSFFDSAVDLICYRSGDAALAALVAEGRQAGSVPAVTSVGLQTALLAVPTVVFTHPVVFFKP